MSLSRIGKLPIEIPSGVTITVDSGNVTVQGPKGKLVQFVTPAVSVEVKDGEFAVTPNDESLEARSQHGLMRSLVNNMVTGVTTGFSKKLVVSGVGFRISGGGQEIELMVGYSHPVKYKALDGVSLTVNKMEITVEGIDKQKVGQVAAEIRAIRKPEPYKGKGIAYSDEQILRKSGKTGK